MLASPDKVDAMCAPLETRGEYSCGRNGHAAINYTRWVPAPTEFADLTQYRQYVVNHEVGHLLGHPHAGARARPARADHAAADGQVAPCVANGWPFPDQATRAARADPGRPGGARARPGAGVGGV